MSTVNIKALFNAHALDDDTDDLEVIKHAIEKTGLKCKLFTQYEHLQEALTADIHVYVVDHTLRPKTGLQMLKEIKSKNPESYFIAYTGTKDPDVMEDYINNKCDGWVNKMKDVNSNFQLLPIALKKGMEMAQNRIEIRDRLDRLSEKFKEDVKG